MRGQVLQGCRVLTGGMELLQRGRRETGHALWSLTLLLFLSFSIQMDRGATLHWAPVSGGGGNAPPQCVSLYRITVNPPSLPLSLYRPSSHSQLCLLPSFFHKSGLRPLGG